MLELDFADHVGVDGRVNVVLGALPHPVHVILVVVDDIVLLYQLQQDLVHLGQQNFLLLLEVAYNELVRYDVPVRVILIAPLDLPVQLHCLHSIYEYEFDVLVPHRISQVVVLLGTLRCSHHVDHGLVAFQNLLFTHLPPPIFTFIWSSILAQFWSPA